ncbi:unnamed protein product [Euphydryas editha]|uniref:HTH CENPB-type domain-containing protein n=1 Tax=Euphydryas editha TaxID=104508 RepID=A0AAU9US52_EUPED|nr:unnamed protein product [Euphydryas editha]
MANKSTQIGIQKQTKSVKKNVLTSDNTNVNSKKKKIKRLNYNQDNVKKALKAVKETGISLRKAAAAFGIPVATLARKNNLDPEKTKSKTGPGTVLSNDEEDSIAKWVLHRAEIGAPVTKSELLDNVQKYVKTIEKKTPFTDDRPSRHWWESFRKRHPELSIRKPQQLSATRAAVTQQDLQDWFKNNQEYLQKKNLLNIPSNRIFNCDESSIQLCPDAERVLAAKGTRAVYKIVDGGKEALTVLFMYRADGIRAPPMLMYSYKKTVPKKIIENTPKGWGIGISDNGWMTSETFYEYITNVFYPWLVKESTQFPVLVYMDNHSSHLNLPLVNFCREKQIELIMLPPNSTHIIQPLDISFFHPFKEIWRKCVPKWKNQQGVTRVTKENFPLVLQFTLNNMPNAEKVVQSGFRGAGLHPFNAKAVDYDILNKGKNVNKLSTIMTPKIAMRLPKNKDFYNC